MAKLQGFASLHAALAVCSVLGAFAAGPAPAQVPGVTREQMWYAPTEDDWKRPVLIDWQRTWEDAVAVSRETGRPILVCVNMDGEIASEHYAGVRYRQPEIAKLYAPYVAVIASVYRHNPRDHDEHGERIPCPRFGGVTCGEHIAIEPLLFEKFMDGQRVAPRHIMVELDGKETYDVFYAFDTDSVFGAIKGGIENRDPGLIKEVRGDRTILERVASRSSADRRSVEDAFRTGDAALRRALLQAAAEHPDSAPVDLLRLAVNGLDEDMARLARSALARSTATDAVDLIGEALQVPMDEPEREGLLAALKKLGAESARARTLVSVNRGLAASSKSVDLGAWGTALSGGQTYAPALDPVAVASRLDGAASSSASENPGDHLDLSDAFLARALEADSGAAGNPWAVALIQDARASARKAESLGAEGWRVQSLLCVTAYYLGEGEEAARRAELAMQALPEDAASFNSMVVLGLFAEHRREQILAKMRAKEEWPEEWMSDVHAAYSVLLRHPHGDDTQVLAHFDFLWGMGGHARARQVLDEGMKRFAGSWLLHERFRAAIIHEGGAKALEPAYEAMLAERVAGAGPKDANLSWFAGYASMVAAEFERRSRRPGEALGAYDRAIAHFERSIEESPETEQTARHFIAMALGGKARIAFHRGENEDSLRWILASFERSPGSAASLDGLNLSTVDTAKLLRARLRESNDGEKLSALQAALDALHPSMLEPPEFDRPAPRSRPGRGARPRREGEGGAQEGGRR